MASKEAPWVEPVILEGTYARLEPLRPKHARELANHAEPELFQFFAALSPKDQSVGAVRDYIAQQRRLPDVVSFAIVSLATRRPVGVTTYMDIRAEHSALEIGMTWLGREHQGTKINPDAKLLLLEHAFERLHAERVQLKTDRRNIQSQRAIEKIGATKEGILRRHSRMPDGYIRDTVMYSVIRDEWPAVKAGLIKRLAAP